MGWNFLGAVGEFVGGIGSILIACFAVYIATRQWLDEKRFAREQQALTEEIERKNEIAKQEQERIVRAQSLDAYFDGISNLLLRDGAFNTTARNLTKGRTDAILKVLTADEKRNLVAFLYGSGLITLDGDTPELVVQLDGSDLSQARLSGATLRNASLNMVNLQGAEFIEADLNEADLRGADLRNTDFRGSDLAMANLQGIVGSTANLSQADLSGADIGGADLRGADLGSSDLTGGNLSGANLRGANLSGANLRGVNLSGANLREANLTNANLLDANLTNLISIEGADFSDVENLTEPSRENLVSIATGTHPGTGKATTESLGVTTTQFVYFD